MDTFAPVVTKPYATTILSDFVQLMGMLRLQWKTFDWPTSNFQAEGNGYHLVGNGNAYLNLGLTFAFRKVNYLTVHLSGTELFQ